MNKMVISMVIVVCLALGACAGMSQTEQRTLSGGALGLGSGYLYGKHKESEQQAYQKGYEAGRQGR